MADWSSVAELPDRPLCRWRYSAGRWLCDYFTLLNERDGGITASSDRIVECETGYNTEKGVECYESTKGEGALVYQPLSTGITYQLIPKARSTTSRLHSMGYGRTSAANGKVF